MARLKAEANHIILRLLRAWQPRDTTVLHPSGMPRLICYGRAGGEGRTSGSLPLMLPELSRTPRAWLRPSAGMQPSGRRWPTSCRRPRCGAPGGAAYAARAFEAAAISPPRKASFRLCRKIAPEPFQCKARHFFQRARLLEQVACARHDRHFLLPGCEPVKRVPVQFHDKLVVSPDD